MIGKKYKKDEVQNVSSSFLYCMSYFLLSYHQLSFHCLAGKQELRQPWRRSRTAGLLS